MSDHPTGSQPEEASSLHDSALDAVLGPWLAQAADPIDVEAALARVTARRREGAAAPAVDELAARRALRPPLAASVPATPRWKRSGLRAAAVLAIALGAAGLWQGTRPAAVITSYATVTGASQTIRLSDGTAVRLGPASSLILETGYGESHRRVTLRGEAWFEVSHDEARPFAIRVGGTTVEDVGTAFLVRESAQREVSVRVAEGAVRIHTTGASTDSTVMLRAGDGAVATPAGITVSTGAVSTAEGSALAAGRLTFTDASLVEVQEALHRWYGVALIVSDSALAHRHVTADFTGEPLSRVAAVLGLTLGVRAESHGDTIELTSGAGMSTRP